MNLNPGDKVFVLYEYGLEEAVVISARGTKTVLVEHTDPFYNNHRQRAKVEKVVRPGEEIAVVWEMWKGVNGRGGYRVERELYADRRVPVEDWPWKGYLWETEHGTLHKHWTP